MKTNRRLALAAIGCALLAWTAAAQTLTNPTYTTPQATEGKALYAQNCASCHGTTLDDGEFAPPLKGSPFRQNWGGKSVDALFLYTSTKMPPGNPGQIGDSGYAQLLAYILQQNGSPAGLQALSSDPAVLQTMQMPGFAGGPGGGLSPGSPNPPAPKKNNPLDKITLVTDAMLAKPPDGEWLTWRRTYDDQGFSPLKQINTKNIGNLRVVWSWSLPNGPNEATPLVHDGVLFVHSYGDKVQALDAVTGDLLWQYSRRLPKDVPVGVKRNIAISGDKLYIPTSDAHMVALDVKTGKVVWDQLVGDRKSGAGLSGGPLVAKGKVMIGTNGRAPGGNYIVGLDAQTGKEEWRFYVIARPGEPGGNSWNGLPLEKRNGASVWTAGSYDPALNLAFFGPAQTYDTGPLLHPVNQPGVTNDALYTDSTIALNPDTGKLVWYYQHLPNDQWDLDWAFERQIIPMNVNGTVKKVIVTGGKQGIYDVLEADTGKYVFSKDLGMQNVVSAIDPKTGAKTINPAVIPGDGKTKLVCPHAGGGRSWIPTSYNPETKVLYTPMVETCMELLPVGEGERGGLSSGVRWTIRARPDSDGKFGRIQALNLVTRETTWIDRQRAPQTTGMLATAGGTVFAGSMDRVFSAYDSATGKQLWHIRLNDVPNSNPITYTVNGKQYVAMVVGNGGAQAATFPPLLPELENPPDRGAAIWVFALPE